MLDLGQADFAWQIARTALDLWKGETELTYHSFEHFMIETGRGGGWHSFGGLDCPVLYWFGTYFRPGRLTGGYDMLITEMDFAPDHSRLRAGLRTYGEEDKPMSLVATMQPGRQYQVTWNDQPVKTAEIFPGVLSLTIPRTPGLGQLKIIP